MLLRPPPATGAPSRVSGRAQAGSFGFGRIGGRAETRPGLGERRARGDAHVERRTARLVGVSGRVAGVGGCAVVSTSKATTVTRLGVGAANDGRFRGRARVEQRSCAFFRLATARFELSAGTQLAPER